MTLFKKLFFLLMVLVLNTVLTYSATQDSTLVFKNDNKILRIENGISIFKDPSKSLTINEVINRKFEYLNQKVPNLGITLIKYGSNSP